MPARRGTPPETGASRRYGERIRTTEQRWHQAERASTVVLPAPEPFSLVGNPAEVARFFHDIERACAGGSHVRVDLREAHALTSDAVAVLVSRVNERRYTHRMEVSGLLPADPAAVSILAECGFFEHVEVDGPRPPANGRGQIQTRRSYKVEAARTDALLRQVNDIVPGTEFAWDGVQRVIVESMNNTENHARGGKAGRERWWLSVHSDPTAGVARFCFFDNGVGIFESLRRKRLLHVLADGLGLNQRPAFLRKVLAGEVPSSTGLGYRGKGLPKIAGAHARNQFRRLIILANDVYADVERDDFRTIPFAFSGTFLYWEHHGA